MAYTGYDSYEKEIYDKLIEAGVSDREANAMARKIVKMYRGYDGGFVRWVPEPEFITWLRSKF